MLKQIEGTITGRTSKNGFRFSAYTANNARVFYSYKLLYDNMICLPQTCHYYRRGQKKIKKKDKSATVSATLGTAATDLLFLIKIETMI
jgi:hypothetical protein